jgi:hypothetical protein
LLRLQLQAEQPRPLSGRYVSLSEVKCVEAIAHFKLRLQCALHHGSPPALLFEAAPGCCNACKRIT